MKDNLIGQFCRKPDGERVHVIEVIPAEGGMPERALFDYIEGSKKGERGIGPVGSLEPLGFGVPMVDASELKRFFEEGHQYTRWELVDSPDDFDWDAVSYDGVGYVILRDGSRLDVKPDHYKDEREAWNANRRK